MAENPQGAQLSSSGSVNNTAGGLGLIGGLIGSIGNMLGAGSWRQVKQQKKLNEQAAELNYGYGEKAASNAFERQMQMYERSYDDESPDAKKKQLEDAGLSVGLMYGGSGGMGGSGTASTAPMGAGAGNQQGGKAADPIASSGMALQIGKMASEIAVNQATAKKLNADAEASTEGAETTRQIREFEVALKEEMGKGKWLENIGTEYKYERDPESNSEFVGSHKIFGQQWLNSGGVFRENEAAGVLEAYARASNNEALGTLNMEKAKGYVAELLNGTKIADAARVNAAAAKLNSEFGTGTDFNWKNIGETIIKLLGAIK